VGAGSGPRAVTPPATMQADDLFVIVAALSGEHDAQSGAHRRVDAGVRGQYAPADCGRQRVFFQLAWKQVPDLVGARRQLRVSNNVVRLQPDCTRSA
jgi:hypothetical protein